MSCSTVVFRSCRWHGELLTGFFVLLSVFSWQSTEESKSVTRCYGLLQWTSRLCPSCKLKLDFVSEREFYFSLTAKARTRVILRLTFFTCHGDISGGIWYHNIRHFNTPEVRMAQQWFAIIIRSLFCINWLFWGWGDTVRLLVTCCIRFSPYQNSIRSHERVQAPILFKIHSKST